MNTSANKTVLISGASFAGLSVAYWMNKLGYKVTIVEIANALRVGGTPVNIEGNTINIIKRMGILEQVRSNRIAMELLEFKNADDVTEGSMKLRNTGDELTEDGFEIERDTLLNLLYDLIKNDTKLLFNNGIISLKETNNHMEVTFKDGQLQNYDLVLGCDGIHSSVRKIWFGHEDEYSRFLGQYFSITIVDKLLIRENTTQFFNVPDKAMMLNAYNNKTDIILCFRASTEIQYNYRDEEEQRKIILDQFKGESWRATELLDEMMGSKSFYFDKLCQIKMPFWTKGRVALVGDAGYCASPAAGMGGSLAIDGAAALADAFFKFEGSFEAAFQDYNETFRPFIEEVQERVLHKGLETLLPRTDEAIRKRNKGGVEW